MKVNNWNWLVTVSYIFQQPMFESLHDVCDLEFMRIKYLIVNSRRNVLRISIALPRDETRSFHPRYRSRKSLKLLVRYNSTNLFWNRQSNMRSSSGSKPDIILDLDLGANRYLEWNGCIQVVFRYFIAASVLSLSKHIQWVIVSRLFKFQTLNRNVNFK